MDEKHREEVALFRYGVISELVGRRLAPGEKEKLFRELSSKTWTIPGTDRTTIGRTTIRDWMGLHEAMGFDGLKPVPRSDAGRPRRIPEDVQDLLLALRKERPKAPITTLIRAARLSGNLPADLHLPKSTVHRFLAAHGMGASGPAEGRNGSEPDARAFTFPHVNDLWTSDIMHGPRLLVPGRRDGGKTYLYAFLDDASRVVPFAAFYPAENAACFQDALKQAVLRRGIPRRLYVDNGATFRTHHLRVMCATLSVVLIHSRPHRPRGRGKIERFFRRVRSAFLSLVTDAMLRDLAALNRVFWAWLEAEYHQTPHGGLEQQTPLERYMSEQQLVRQAPDELEALMRMRVLRRVAKDRTVRLDGRLYEAPDGFAGEKVEVLYDPYDPNRPVHFRRTGETDEHPLRRLDLHTNATLRRLKPQADEPPAAPATGISYLDLIADQFYGQEDKT